jgi:hypothetical protein
LTTIYITDQIWSLIESIISWRWVRYSVSICPGMAGTVQESTYQVKRRHSISTYASKGEGRGHQFLCLLILKDAYRRGIRISRLRINFFCVRTNWTTPEEQKLAWDEFGDQLKILEYIKVEHELRAGSWASGL